MADMNINIIQSSSGSPAPQTDSQGNPKRGRKTVGDEKLFVRPRKKSSHNMSISGYFGEKWGDKAYNRVIEKVGNTKEGKEKAKAAKSTVGFAVMMGAEIAKTVVKAGVEGISVSNSDQASQNTIDNIGMVANEGLSLVGAIGMGASVGGVWGAAIAGIATVATKALNIGTEAMRISKQNISRAEESNRKSDRLGYIEAGYSR